MQIACLIREMLRLGNFPMATESNVRSIVKAISWRVTGTVDTFVISFLVTGHLKAAGTIAITEVLTKVLLYYFHERIWNRIKFGKVKDTAELVAGSIVSILRADSNVDENLYYLGRVITSSATTVTVVAIDAAPTATNTSLCIMEIDLTDPCVSMLPVTPDEFESYCIDTPVLRSLY